MDHTNSGQLPGRHARTAHLVIGCTLIVVAIIAIVTALGFPATNLATDVGPARFPLFYAISLIVLCLIMMATHLRKPAPPPQGYAAGPDSMGYLCVAIGMAATALCIFVMFWIGYAITTVLYLWGLMWMMGWRHRWLTPAVAVGVTALLYVLFSLSLNVPLPVGSLFE